MSAVIDQSSNVLQAVAMRTEWLKRLRALSPRDLAGVRYHYELHPVLRVVDWIVGLDPRRAEVGQPTTFPLICFQAQIDMLNFIVDCWRASESGLIEKSRDMGASSLSMALFASLCIGTPNLAIGVGSRKESLVDNASDPASLFAKIRLYLKYLPPELSLPYTSSHMKITFSNGSTIVGESGDQLGRGGRTGLFFLDEAAHIDRAELADAALASNTNCVISASSVCGMANSFATKRFSGRVKVFILDWRSDPKKDAAWRENLIDTVDPLIIAQEYDRSYLGSTANALIPMSWFQSSIGADKVLGIETTGLKFAALDPADVGADKNALALRHGIHLTHLESWSGQDSDLFRSLARAVAVCDEHGIDQLAFDAIGLGAGLKGDMAVINEQRYVAGLPPILDTAVVGSASPWNPESCMITNRKNKDAFLNQKSQNWWHLRQKFQATHRAVHDKRPFDPDSIISIDPKLPELLQLQSEISQIQFSINSSGKLVIDKIGDGQRSPNLADAVCIAFRPETQTLINWIKLAS